MRKAFALSVYSVSQVDRGNASNKKLPRTVAFFKARVPTKYCAVRPCWVPDFHKQIHKYVKHSISYPYILLISYNITY